MKQTTLEEVSAGGVVYRRGERGIEYLIGKHSGYHKWVLPKGLVEPGESYVQTAEREVAEEVGVQAKVVGVAPIKTIEYWYMAELGKEKGRDAQGLVTERRVKKYQEDGAVKTRIHKQVIFYLMELESDQGRPGWEMEERKWVVESEARELLAFESELEVFEVAQSQLLS